MEKKLVVAYTILGIAASVFLAGWLVFHAYRTREANIAQASSRMKEIGTIVASASMSKDFLSSPVFKEKVEAIFKNDHHLDLIAIYDQQENPQYLFARDRSRLGESFFYQGNPKKSPTFSVHPVFQTLVTQELPVSGALPFKAALISTVITRIDMVDRFKIVLVGLLTITLLSAMLLLILPICAREVPQSADGVPQPEKFPPRQEEIEPRHERTEEFDIEIPDIDTPQQEAGTEANESIHDGYGEKTFCGLFSPRSGLGWGDFLEERLTYELKRAASFDQDLVLAIFTIAEEISETDYEFLASKVKENFPFHDLTFEYEHNGFSIVLPNLDIDEGLRKIEIFQKLLLEGIAGKDLTVCVGVSSRNGRLLSGKQLIKEATNSLSKAMEEKKSCVIGFRSDPTKYRQFVAAKRHGSM